MTNQNIFDLTEQFWRLLVGFLADPISYIILNSSMNTPTWWDYFQKQTMLVTWYLMNFNTTGIYVSCNVCINSVWLDFYSWISDNQCFPNYHLLIQMSEATCMNPKNYIYAHKKSMNSHVQMTKSDKQNLDGYNRTLLDGNQCKTVITKN